MRPWAIPIIGAVALSFVLPATTNARPQFGAAAVLGAVTAPLGAVLGGIGHGFGHSSAQRARCGAARRARGGAARQ